MSTPVSYIIHRASEMVGLKDFDSDTMDGDSFRKVFLMCQDAIRNLNQQTDIVFGYTDVRVNVSGDKLTFKPYTTEEQAIIDGGGTVDITDRCVTIRPTICPTIYINNNKLCVVEMLDLPMYKDRYTCSWNPDWDNDAIHFGDNVNGEVLCQIRKPIAIPSMPNESLAMPERFNDFIICTVAYNIASILSMVETLPIVKSNLDNARKAITRNNNYHKPVYMNSTMDRFL